MSRRSSILRSLRALLLVPFLGTAVETGAVEFRLEQDAHGLGMGGAVAAVSGASHAVLWNPAGIARATVPMIQLGGGFGPAPLGVGLNGSILYPVRDNTVFGFSRFSDHPKIGVASTIHLASFAVPLSGNRDLLFGANLKFLRLREELGTWTRQGRGIGLDLGLSYDLHFPSRARLLSFGAAVKDADTQVRFDGTGEEPVVRAFTAGVAYQEPNMRVELDYETVGRLRRASLLHDRLRIGAERFLLNRDLSVRIGYDDLLQNGGHFSAGAGYHPAGAFEVAYAALLDEETLDLSHHVSAVYRFDRWMRYGSASSAAPVEIDLALAPSEVRPSIQPSGAPVAGIPLKKRRFLVEPAAFSPNGDGVDDAVTVRLPGVREGELNRWTLDVISADLQGVRRMAGDGTLPPTIVWDGMDGEGRACQDGEYRMVLRTYGTGDALLSDDVRGVTISTGRVSVSLRAARRTFSTRRGARMTFTVLAEGLPRVGSWEFEVSEPGTNRVVSAAQGRDQLPRRLEWAGKDAKGVAAPDGNYLCMLVVSDPAGKRLQSDAVRIAVDNSPPELRVTVPSPWMDRAKETNLPFRLDATDRSGLADWRLALLNDEGRELRIYEGRGQPPGSIAWDGTDGRGGVFPPGTFVVARLSGADLAGNLGTSADVGIQVTISPPTGQAQLSLNLTTVQFAKEGDAISEAVKRELDQAAQSIRPYLEKSVILVKGYVSGDESGDPLLLSRRRAVAVRNHLAGALGVPEGRLVAIALGAQDPLQTPAGVAPPEKQRRVVVTLYTQR